LLYGASSAPSPPEGANQGENPSLPPERFSPFLFAPSLYDARPPKAGRLKKSATAGTTEINAHLRFEREAGHLPKSFRPAECVQEPRAMSASTILIIVLVLILIGALPAWPYSRSWNYAPTGLVGIILLIVIVLVLMRVI
jgi:hypothetical protein